MAKARIPEFFVRLKRFINFKEDEVFSDEIVNVQPTLSMLAARDPDGNVIQELETVSATLPHLKVQLMDDTTTAPVVVLNGAGDGLPTGNLGLLTYNRSHAFDGATWRRIRVPDATQASAGASALTIVAAGGAGNFTRVHDIVLSTDNAGLVILSDGLPSIQLPANGSIHINFKDGWLQDTANTAITATLAGATLAAGVTFNLET